MRARALIAVLVGLWFAVPAAAQRAPSFPPAAHVGWMAPEAPPLPPGALALDRDGRHALSRTSATLAGLGIGAAAGGVAFLALSGGCWRRGESMCELAIPIYVGAGAAVGGLIGYLLGGRRAGAAGS